ncbi:MAG: DUF4212 domain-containing protein [Egibacteraceae bacterium]
MDEAQKVEYWRANVKTVVVLLSVWALVSFGFSILLVEPLNNIVINGFPMGFWWAQQGAEITFVILIAVYVLRMQKLDDSYGVGRESKQSKQEGAGA